MKQIRKPDYSVGEHQAWEAQLHASRAIALAEGRELTPVEELMLIAAFMEHHKKDYDAATTCDICADFIADSSLNKEDPFICPPEIKKLFLDAANKFWRYRK